LGRKFSRIAIIGDTKGINDLLNCVPLERVACLVGASRRPQYLGDIETLAIRIGRPLFVQPQPSRPEHGLFVQQIRHLGVDLLLCNSYSMLLTSHILDTVGYNAINIHAALLPKNRGPNPIQWCLIKGEMTTGVTMHYIDDDVDSGDIIAQRRISIGDEDTWVTLSTKLDQEIQALLDHELPRVLAGTNSRIPQDSHLATRNSRLTPDYPQIDWKTMSDKDVYNLIRAQIKPLSGAYAHHRGKRIMLDEFVPLNRIAELRRQYVIC
jgi:methionyl-tRNA formyltransferase